MRLFRKNIPSTSRQLVFHQTGSRFGSGKFLLFALIALFISSTAISTVTPIVANAVTTSANNTKDPAWQVKSLLYYRALGDCIKNATWGGATSQLSAADADSGSWFKNSDIRPAVGPYLRGSVTDNNDADVRASCVTNSDLVNPALELWGWTKDEALCAFGAKRANDSPCLSSNGGNGAWKRGTLNADTYKNAVKTKIYAINTDQEPSLSNDAYWYEFYARVFGQSCAFRRSPVSTPPSDITSGGSMGYKILKAQADGKPTTIYYLGNLTRDHSISTRPASIENTGSLSSRSVDMTCAEIEERVNNYAPRFSMLVAADPSIPLVDIGTEGDDPGDETSCAIDGIGWIICPVMTFMGYIVDGSYDAVEGLLITPPLNINTADPENGTYQAWSIMRNFANVAFVVAFLIIIFSQITSVGIGNYGIKKLLPRLVIAAILVNVSFFVCAIAVDISNILGGSANQLFNGIGRQIETPNFESVGATGEGWVGIVGFVLGATGITLAIMYAHISILLPALIAAIAAIVTIFLVLTLRQALIIMLIVISPLAFVAFLLPNTDGLFTKWRKLFTTLLLMFPIIAFIFGASALASKIIMASDESSFAVQIMGALIALIPLFITPVVMKAAGGVLNRFGGIVNNPNKGVFSAMRKRADGYRESSQNIRTGNALIGKRVFGGGQFRRKARRDLNSQKAKDMASAGVAAFSTADDTAAEYANSSANSQLATSALNNARNARITQGLAKVDGNLGVLGAMGSAAADNESVKNALDAQTKKAVDDAIKDIKLTSKIAPGDLAAVGEAFKKAVDEGDSLTARAMQDTMLTAGGAGIKQWRQSVSDIEQSNGGAGIGGDMGTELRSHLLDNQPGIKAQDASAMAWATNQPDPTSHTHKTLQALQSESKTWQITNEEFAGQKAFAQLDAIRSGAIGQQAAQEIFDNKQLYDRIDKGVKIEIDRLINSSSPPRTTPSDGQPDTPQAPPPGNYFS